VFMSETLRDVYTAEEVARAAGVPIDAVNELIAAAEVRRIAGTLFFSAEEAVQAGRRLKERRTAAVLALAATAAPEPLFARVVQKSRFADRQRGVHAAASSAIHVALLAVLLWWTSGTTETATIAEHHEPARMVFLISPGPGGGGGGGGLKNPLPARKVERKSPARAQTQVPRVTPERVLASRRVVEEPPRPVPPPAPQPKPIEKAPEPLPSRVLVAPVVATAGSDRDRDGVVERGKEAGESQGAGVGGGAGTGKGAGSGEGLGSGIGDGSGGGTGGGPFRPGSGIEPPRLLREVKAEYTDEARRRGITGDVVLEIVVKRDGSVGDVTILQGRGAGLDQRAVAAVRQWRFSPARRRSEAVDVIVEVAVEFTLR
jgi:periplasmic protein TonB